MLGSSREELLNQDRVWVDFEGEPYYVSDMSVRYKLNLLLWILQRKGRHFQASDYALTDRLYQDIVAGRGGTAGDDPAKLRRYKRFIRQRSCGCPAFDCDCTGPS